MKGSVGTEFQLLNELITGMKGTTQTAYSQWQCNNSVWWQVLATLVVNTAYRVAESLCCMPEINVTLWSNYSLIKKKKKIWIQQRNEEEGKSDK